MNEIQYTGELFSIHRLGFFLILLSFFSAIASSIALFRYFLQKEKDESWYSIGKWSFITHGISTYSIIGMIFYLMVNKRYEFSYVYDHISNDLATRYLFASFWEGQEGSFLLWMFWHVFLAAIFLFRKSKWSVPVIAVIVTVQAFLASMLLGIHLPFGEEGFKIGSNPLTLLRQVFDAPIFNNADYMQSLTDGNGLNPTLQNYWMTIHPPTLFLGFASTVVPFAFAIGSLLNKEYEDWIRPAMSWCMFSAFILGLGILMGGAWAYEALTFGGYWAWDPVENTSLVPWITLVAGVHTHLIARNTKYSIKSTYFFYILSFLLILYSTFLTRSGILGDSSVHAFTEMGLEWQLIVFMVFFAVVGFGLLIARGPSIPTPKKEEAFSSREFWMFIGSITLLFSALLISFSTSLPVFNKVIKKLLDPEHVGMVITDPIDHHNRFQIWIAIFIALLSSTSIFLRYKAFNWSKLKNKFFIHIGVAALISVVITLLIYPVIQLKSGAVMAFIFAGAFAISANLDYMITVLKGNFKAGASAIAHFGFGVLIFGVIFTGANEYHITSEPFSQNDFLTEEDAKENIRLIKGKRFFSQGYWISYLSDTLINHDRIFDIKFEETNENEEVIDSFHMYPSAVYNLPFTKIASWNPATKHYIWSDIFATVSGYPVHLRDAEAAKEMEDTLNYSTINRSLQDSFITQYGVGILESIELGEDREIRDSVRTDLSLTLDIKFVSERLRDTFYASPALALSDGLIYQYPDVVNALGLKLKLDESLFAAVFTEERNLKYQEFALKQGESIKWNGYDVTILGFDKDFSSPNYTPQDGDIAVAAQLQFSNPDTSFVATPLLLIRGKTQNDIKDYRVMPGIHSRFVNIDPTNNQFTILLAADERSYDNIPLIFAENVPRSDLIVLDAKVMPGINLVWLGSLLMLFGLLLGSIFRRVKKRTA